MLNLFNLLPIGSMDGGRIAGAISPYMQLAGLGAGGALIYAGVVHHPIFYLIMLAGSLPPRASPCLPSPLWSLSRLREKYPLWPRGVESMHESMLPVASSQAPRPPRPPPAAPAAGTYSTYK